MGDKDNNELHGWIAKHVFGLNVQRVDRAWYPDEWLSDFSGHRNMLAIINGPEAARGFIPPAEMPPSYSTDIDAAWMVLRYCTSDASPIRDAFIAWWKDLDSHTMPSDDAARAITHRARDLMLPIIGESHGE